MFVQHDLSPLLLYGIRDRLGEQPGLFDEAKDRLVNMLQCVHKSDVHCLSPKSEAGDVQPRSRFAVPPGTASFSIIHATHATMGARG